MVKIEEDKGIPHEMLLQLNTRTDKHRLRPPRQDEYFMTYRIAHETSVPRFVSNLMFGAPLGLVYKNTLISRTKVRRTIFKGERE